MGEYAGALLFQYGDAEALAERLRWLLHRPLDEAQHIGVYLRKRVVALHSLETTATRILAVLKSRAVPTASGSKVLRL